MKNHLKKGSQFGFSHRSWMGIKVGLMTALCLFLESPMGLTQSPSIESTFSQEKILGVIRQLENKWQGDYVGYYGRSFPKSVQNISQIENTLNTINRQTGTKSAVIWIFPRKDQLEILLVVPGSPPIHRSIYEAKKERVFAVVKEFMGEINNPRKVNSHSYLTSSQQLYQWMIAPIASILQENQIDTLLFCVGGGLRLIPFAALHDGQKFLIEKYSMVRIPAFSLTQINYQDIRKTPILAMGASQFTKLNALPAVPLELSTITAQGKGVNFLNQQFTLDNLQEQRLSGKFRVIHLATHAEFKPGLPQNSYIQFWDKPLYLSQISQLGWQNPPVELLVLSACRTALGDREVELGFAGLAAQAGVKSVVASLWYVSDAGTLALMTQFYQALSINSTKANALRQAQIGMIYGQTRLEKGRLLSSRGEVTLPDSLGDTNAVNLSHPYYWAAFTMIGSPW